jgi:nicotinate-nucleotide--dimethylbenzimidazole phosphoribosyltransferase
VEPRIVDYLFAAHRSVEPAHEAMLSLLGLAPILDLGLRLGEGTGCALAMPIIEAGVKVIREMATFAEAGVSSGP